MTNSLDPIGAMFPQSSPAFANAQKFFFAAARLQGNALKAGLRYNIETLAFLKQRLEKDMKLVDDLVASDGFKDAFDIYAGFVENAAAEYAAESSKIAGIGSRIASETAKRVREEAQASIDDMAAQTVSA